MDKRREKKIGKLLSKERFHSEFSLLAGYLLTLEVYRSIKT